MSLEPGRGKKKCNSCSHYVGIRSQFCSFCKAEFITKDVIKVEKREEVVSRPDNVSFIIVPGTGHPATHKICPIKLENKDEIKEWMKKLQLLAWKDGYEYSCMALKYMAQEFFPRYPAGVKNEEYVEVCNIITKLCKEEEDNRNNQEVIENANTY